MKKRSLFLILMLVLSGCGNTTSQTQNFAENTKNSDATPYSEEIFAMDTVMSLTAYGESGELAVTSAKSEITRLDALFSISSEGGDVFAVNQTGTAEVSEETADLVHRALEFCDSTGGAFDCTIQPLMELWGFPTQNYRLPSQDEIDQTLRLVDSRRLSADGTSISLGQAGMALDLGGIAKGYTSSKVIDIFREQGVTSGMVSLGGNVQLLGTKPDGSDWRVAIQDPENPESVIGVLSTSDTAVITSGGYQRYFEQDGETYHHILDPKTGYPAENGLISVTIVSPDGTLADALSTSLFVMGLDDAQSYWRAHSDEFDCILLTDEGETYISAGISDCYESDGSVTIFE